MRQKASLCVMLCLSALLIGCIGIEPALSGRAYDEYQKSIKPYLQYWEKDGVTAEGRRQDSISCGSIDPSLRHEPDSEPHFTQDKIEAAQRAGDQSTTTAEGRLLFDWQRCMLNKGYRCTKAWMLLPENR
jgi:hypothetical protein